MKIEFDEIEVGNEILCDICNEDYTNSDEHGGFLFESKGICPKCAPSFEKSARGYGEEKYITERCKKGESFKDFILRIRQGDNAIKIFSF